MNIQLPSKTLKAVAKFASKDSNRYMLKSVVVTSDGKSHTIYSTDGRRAIVVSIQGNPNAEQVEPESCIIPLETVLRQKTQLVSLRKTEDGDVWALGDELFKQPVGKYPSLDRVMPQGSMSGGVPHSLDPRFIVDASEAAKSMGATGVSFSSKNGSDVDCCIVDFSFPSKFSDIEAVAIIMPLRGDINTKPLRERFTSSLIETK